MLVSIHSRLSPVLATLCLVGTTLFAFSANSLAQSSANLPTGVSATVNGRPIATEMVNKVESQLAQEEARTSREDILLELIDLEVLTQRAEAQKLDSQPDIAATLRLQYAQTMANAYLESLSNELIVTDEQVRAEYDTQIQLLERPEYRASHILLDTEADATNAIAALDAGEDFADLARDLSTGPSATQGGDLGWFDDNTMMVEFTVAVSQLEINEYTKKPVQTQFGWHVIQLFDKRSGSMPDFNTVKNGIRNLMIQNLLNERLSALREEAEINTAQ